MPGRCTRGPTPGIRFPGPRGPGGLVWLLRCTSFSSALGVLLLFRTGTGRGVMREAMALSGKEIGLGRETDLDLKPGSFTFSF